MMPLSLPTSSSSKQLAGPVRPANNSRVHALQKPYDRPASTVGSQQDAARPAGLPRSGSESSLFGGLRSMLYQPIASLFGTPARPSRKEKDETSSFGDGASIRAREDDEEMDLSPTFRRETKRIRRDSPPRQLPNGTPTIGRAVTGTMVAPTLPPFLDLTPTKRNPGLGPPPRSTTRGINFSRPLIPTSASMSYLDPPVSSLGGSPSRKTPTRRLGGGLSRSSARLDLSAMDEPAPASVENPRESWSAWQVDRVASTTSQTAGPSARRSQLSQLPSQSPFSPARAAATSSMPRSTTSLQLNRGASTSRSMAQSGRSASGFNLASFATHRERQVSETPSRFSVDATRTGREDSVLDWYMTDRWTSIRAHPHREQSVASTRAPQALPTVRKGQMVWNADAGFVRADRLVPEPTQPLLQNDAERILHALESLRTPLTDARSSAELRKAVNVPLASASTSGDSQRSKKRTPSASSVMISPYGRRREKERAGRSEEGGMRQLLARRDVQRAEDDATSAWSKSDASMVGSAAESDSGHKEETDEEEEEEEEQEEEDRTPTPPPAPTPRRSRRNQHRSPSPLPPTPPPKNAATSKANKGKGKAVIPTITTTSTTPVKSPPKKDAPELPVDSYQPGKVSVGGSSLRAKSTQSSRQHTPAPSGASGSHGSGRFSAREDDLPDVNEIEQAAKISLPSFTGISFAGFDQTPKSISQSNGKRKMAEEIEAEDSSAKEDPSLEPATGSSLISRLSPAPTAAPAAPASAAAPPASPNKPSLGLRAPGITSRPRASSPLANNSITAPPPSPPTTAPAPVQAAPAAVSKPATSFSFGAPPKVDDGPKKTLGFGIGKPPAPTSASTPAASTPGGIPNFFGGSTAAPPPPAPAGSSLKFSFAPSPSSSPAPAGPTSQAAPPAFSFGSSSTPASSAATPAAEAPNPFAGVGTAAKPSTEAPNPFAGVGTPAASSVSSPSTTSAPAPAAATFAGFGAPVAQAAAPSKTTEPANSTAFSFGASTATSASLPASASSPVPSFGGFGSKPADATSKPPAAPPAAATFSFGGPAKVAEPAPAAKPASPFSFGQAAAPAPASNGFGTPATPSFGAPSSTPAATAPFSFGAASETSKDPKPAATPTPAASFSFGASKPAAGGFGSSSTSTSFGAAPSAVNGGSNGFGAAAPSNGFSFGSTKPAAPTSGGFGTPSGLTSPTSAPAPTFGFGASPAPSNPFGAPAAPGPPTASATNPAPSFSFGASSQPSTGFGNSAPAASTGFGAPAPPAQTSGGFGFGASSSSNATPVAAAPPSFGFGTTTAPTPASNGFGFQSPPPAAAPAPSFSFGGAATTTPAAAPPAQFSFGAAAGGAPRFGSPGPGSPAPEGGGFSLGAAGDTPGSPGGRKIKPLRARKK